jgi:hypothetical protein
MKKVNYIALFSSLIISFLYLFSLFDNQDSFGMINSTSNETSSTLPNLSKITTLGNISFSNYEDMDRIFKMQYPSEWELDNGNSKEHTAISFKPKNLDIHVSVTITPNSEYKLKKYENKEFKENNNYTLLGYYRNSTTTLGGHPALKAIYLTQYTPNIIENKFGNTSSTLKGLITATFIEPKNSFYAIVYFASPQLFSYYLPIIEQMIKSFQFY